MSQVKTDVENFQNYRGDKYSIASVIGALMLKLLQSSGAINNSTQTYTNSNYSGAIAAANTPQDLTNANQYRDRITIQNLDSTDVLLVGIGEDAVSGRSYEIDPRGVGVIEEGEADKRISVMSTKVGLKFVAIGRVRN
jgi:hypothetical protein